MSLASNLDDDTQAKPTEISLAEQSCTVYFPDNVIRHVTTMLVNSEHEKSSLVFDLVSMCGVCRQWRQIVPLVGVTVPLTYDSSYPSNPHKNKLLKKFQKLKNVKKQQEFLIYASKLFQSSKELVLKGNAVCDRVLCDVILNNRNIQKIAIKSTQNLSDVGLVTMSMIATNLKEIILEQIPNLNGSFISSVLHNCTNLKNLRLRGLTGLKWEEFQKNSHNWPICRNIKLLQIQTGDNYNDFSSIIQNSPNLHMLDVDGTPKNIITAAKSNEQINHLIYKIHQNNILNFALPAIKNMKNIAILEIVVKNGFISPTEMKYLGLISVDDLRIISLQNQNNSDYLNKFQLHLNQNNNTNKMYNSKIGQLSNQGIKALVDGILQRLKNNNLIHNNFIYNDNNINNNFQQSFSINDFNSGFSNFRPLKLTLSGASQISHECVGDLLRLPCLIKLCLKGCNKIPAMDKMRLKAKVKAGLELFSLKK